MEVSEFIIKRAKREQMGWFNWPLGQPVTLGDIGHTARGVFNTAGGSDLKDLGINFETRDDPNADALDWQHTEDRGFELFVKGGTTQAPSWSTLATAELGFGVRFGTKGSYCIVIPELRWKRVHVTQALLEQLKDARRAKTIRGADRIVMAVAEASSYTVLVSTEGDSEIEFSAQGKFASIADVGAGFSIKRKRGSLFSQVGKSGGVLFFHLARVGVLGSTVPARRFTSGTKSTEKELQSAAIQLQSVDQVDSLEGLDNDGA